MPGTARVGEKRRRSSKVLAIIRHQKREGQEEGRDSSETLLMMSEGVFSGWSSPSPGSTGGSAQPVLQVEDLENAQAKQSKL